MSNASIPADDRDETRTERRQHWIAVFSSALVHVAFLLLAMLSPPITVTPPQGNAAGGAMVVDFVGATPLQPTHAPPVGPPMPSAPAPKSPAASRVQSTPVPRADNPVPPVAPDDAAQGQAQAPTVPPPPTPQRRAHVWGQPPGMLPRESSASENIGRARSPGLDTGRSNDAASAEPSLEVGGYQVYYDLRSEIRLRAWRDQGMTEIFLPLPGTRRYMVCPLETALRRGSGPCRMLEPDAPELDSIGDAREVINMEQVYRQGEPVWRGPGPYR